MALTSYGGGLLFGRSFGDGPPAVIALHGWGRKSDDFKAILAGMDAIAFDLPGFGASPAPESVIGPRDYADQLARVLEEMGGAPVVLGHSFGGRVAVCLAARHPDLVDRLVLTGVPLLRRPGTGKPPLGYRILRLGHRLRVVSDQRMEAIRRSRGSADYRAASGIMREVLVKTVNESYEDELGSITCSVELIWGSEDGDAPAAVAREAAAILNSAGVDVSLHVVDGAGHFLPIERPELFRERLRQEGAK